MNGKGGCCIAKYGGGGGGGGGMSKVDRIMLKFRPIAPKPVADGSASGGLATDNSNGYVKCGRIKRKYVRVKKNKNDNSKRRGDESMKFKAWSSSSPPVVTLPLLPEIPDRKLKTVTGSSDLLSPVVITTCRNSSSINNKKMLAPGPVWLSFKDQELVRVHKPVQPPPARLPQVVSYVTVESVTDTWVDWKVLGCTDEEIMMNMEKDTCPGFISDGQDRVVWTNTAFRNMSGIGHVIDGDDIAVVLVRKDERTRSPVTYPAFTCKVRVTFAAVHGHRKTTSPCSPALTLPCDGWRMERGSCAWRLDVIAALSLGSLQWAC
ncbi:hypothetical protein R6Q59_036967 [Mikania micrantha]